MRKEDIERDEYTAYMEELDDLLEEYLRPKDKDTEDNDMIIEFLN